MKADKKFDCVEMKNRIQEELLQEYDRRKDEFASYADFISKTLRESPWARELQDKLRSKSKAA